MSERYRRSQLLLEPEQHQKMREIAEREGRSISDVARGLIESGLERMAKDEQARFERNAAALDGLREIREAAQGRYGIYAGDLLSEVRAQREEALDKIKRQEA
jgi:hypothetical protein